MNPERRAIWALLAFLIPLGSPLLSDETDPVDDPRVGGRPGRLRYRIVKSPAEEVPSPDVLTLKDGRKLEAYYLEPYGDWFVFYVKESNLSWLKEEIPRAEVASVNLQTYLPKDPVQPRKIDRAEKQPVPKEDILHGVFRASRGRRQPIDFKITFSSETDKLADYVEDATDYGVVEVESQTRETGRRAVDRSHKVHGWGRYYLYSPGSVNNTDWVLVLSGVVQNERDRQGRETTLTTASVLDETFMIRFSPDKDTFRLEFSTEGEWTWGTLLDMTFDRVEEDATSPPPPAEPRPRTPRSSVAGGSSPALARGEESPRRPRWGIDGWKAPAYRLR